jgi:hypothetical protein
MLDFLTSPGGGLLWDLFLLALGIFITVVILQRYFERQEEKRWRPARQDLYRRLFSHAGWLIRMLPDDVRTGGPQTEHRFGYRSVAGRVDPAFSRSIGRLKPERLKDVVEGLADEPTALEEFEKRLDETLSPSATILLAKDPGLSGRLADLREWMSSVEDFLEGYREIREAGREAGTDPGRRATSDVLRQACVHVKELIIEADRLRIWLAGYAEGIGPAGFDHRP